MHNSTVKGNVLKNPLADIAVGIEERELEPLMIIVIGENVFLRKHLNWFEPRNQSAVPAKQ